MAMAAAADTRAGRRASLVVGQPAAAVNWRNRSRSCWWWLAEARLEHCSASTAGREDCREARVTAWHCLRPAERRLNATGVIGLKIWVMDGWRTTIDATHGDSPQKRDKLGTWSNEHGFEKTSILRRRERRGLPCNSDGFHWRRETWPEKLAEPSSEVRRNASCRCRTSARSETGWQEKEEKI
jgi:hypothetical protein